MVNCINLIIEMSPRFILGRENVPCVAEVVNRSLKADCTNYTTADAHGKFESGAKVQAAVPSISQPRRVYREIYENKDTLKTGGKARRRAVICCAPLFAWRCVSLSHKFIIRSKNGEAIIQ